MILFLELLYNYMYLEVRVHTIETKQKAVELRKSGLTYDEIARRLNLSKSTLSIWLKGMPFPQNSTLEAKKMYFLENVQKKGAAANKHKKEEMWRLLRDEATTLVAALDTKDGQLLLSLLSILYWAEGTKYDKGGVVFTNTDPKLSYLFLDLLRKTCEINEERLRVRLHLHYYHKKKEAIIFWSNLLKIPTGQFQSVYVKKRSRNKRFRQNFMGICFIKYGDSKTRRKILSYAYALQEHLAPVAQLD